MKRLYILRHAKAESDKLGKPDIERHLNKQGRNDAAQVTKIMIEKSYLPSHIFSSPSIRTIETSEIFLEKIENCTFKIETSLYHGDIDDVLNLCYEFDESVLAPMIVFHNPGITYFANVICDANILNVPTCGLLVLDINTSTWKSIDPSVIKLIDFITPE